LIRENIGETLNASVSLGKWSDNTVAVKYPKFNIKVRHDDIKAIIKEIALLRTLSHPHLAFILGACLRLDSPIFYLTRYEPIGNLESLIMGEEEISVEKSIIFGLQVIKAIIYLHENSPAIAIGNLKPSNILVLK
jgi:serine/threonine protein kinase